VREFFVFFVFCLYSPSLFAQQKLSTERFGDMEIVTEKEDPDFTILFFSESFGIDDTARIIAKSIAKNGAQVAIIDTSVYLQNLEKDNDGCSYLGGEMVRLNQSILSSLKVKDYHLPVLGGMGQGASLAYSIFNQKPDEFLGLVTFDFCPVLKNAIKFCDSEFVTFESFQATQQKILPPKGEVQQPWHQLSTSNATSNCNVPTLAKYTKMFDENKIYQIPPDTKASLDSSLKELILSLYTEIRAKLKSRVDNILKLPLIELTAKDTSRKSLIIFLSGDGGWATIDKEIAIHLQERGFSVIGFDSLKFFWEKRNPEVTARAIEDIFNKYRKDARAENLILIGFSFGAEVLPFSLSKLSDGTKHSIKSIILLNPGLASDFEIKISDWILPDDEKGEFNVKLGIKEIKDYPTFCLYGEDDEDNACMGVGSANVKVIPQPGDHHFDGDYSKLGDLLIELIEGSGRK